MRLRPLHLFALLALSASAGGFLAGCSGKAVDENDPGALLKEAEEDIQSDHYQLAVDKLRAIKNKFPYSKYALEAQIRIADVYFMQESYGEAALAYEAFRDLHPKHERVAYAMFRIGLSYLNDSPSLVARDLTPDQKALDAFNDFLKRFPAAPEAEEARKDVVLIRNKLAEKELYIANFYQKRGVDESARERYKKLLALYPDTVPAKEAREKLDKIGETSPPRKTEKSQ